MTTPGPSPISAVTIEEAKARYERLKSSGQTEGAFEARRDAAPRTPDEIPAQSIVLADTIPVGWYFHALVRAGEVLRVDNPGGNPGIPLMLWNAHEPGERLNPPDTVKVQWTAAIGRGRVLLTDMGRAIASIIDGPDGMVDCIAGISSAASNRLRANDPALPNARDQFLKAGAKYGLGKRDLASAVTLFAPITVAGDGTLEWDDAAPLAGRFDLRIEMDAIVAVANCPHPLSPAVSAAEPITLTIWQPDPPGEDDLCRTATSEAARAFINNAAMRTGVGR